MFFPNSNSENVFVFDSYTKFADAVAAFKKGANVFYQTGTTYDMMTSYEGGALKGNKYAVDENGASETGGGGGGESPFFVVRFSANDDVWSCDRTYEEITSALDSGKIVIGYRHDIGSNFAATLFYGVIRINSKTARRYR